MKKQCRFVFFPMLLLLFSVQLFAQQIEVKGRIVDSTTPTGIPGVAIISKESGSGTVTDNEGNYSIRVDNDATLVVSFLGYTQQIVPVGGRTKIDITLSEDTHTLYDVVVIAYGTQSKVSITGALSTISNKELVKSPTASITNVLAGALPGVSSVQSSGQPGSDAATIYIRGSGSLSDAAGKPLILVDGIERDFSQLDPNEIESISVLKDASSTAVFGVRGANGVVLVTTRRGSMGKPSINISASVGVQQPIAMIEQVGSYEYAKFWNVKADMDGATNKFTKEQMEAYRTGSDPIFRPNVNWNDYMFNDLSLQSKNNINISGGSESVKYFISLGHLYQNGILKKFNAMPYDNNYSYNRFNYRANLDIKLSKTTDMKVGVGGYSGTTQQPNSTHDYSWGDPTWTMVQVWAIPFSGAGLVDGVRTQVPSSSLPTGEIRDGFTPFFGSGYRQQYNTSLNLDVDITQKLDFIAKGLSVSVKGAYDNKFLLTKNRRGGGIEYQTAWHKTFLENSTTPETSVDYDKTIVYVPTGSNTPLSYGENYNRDRNWYFEARLNYDHTFGNDHKVGALALYNMSRDYYPTTTSDELAQYWYMPRGYIGFVGRATYGFRNKYLLDLSMGYNGSENFAPGKGRYGLFPSISAGWVISEENFMKKQNIVNYLKIRASYGKVGSDVGTQTRFMYKPSSWSSGGNYSFGEDNATSSEGYAHGTPGNAAVTWETALKQNYGLDATLLKNRLSLGVDYFLEHRTGILISPNSFPSIIAISLPNMNLGIVDNHGYEVALGWNDTTAGGFHYHVNANMSFARNKIVYMDEIESEYSYQNVTGGSTGRNTGLYQFLRLYQDSDFETDANGKQVLNPALPQPYVTVSPGDSMFADMNGDGFVNTKDQTVTGYSKRPEYTFGLNAGFDYKGFNFSMQWTGATNVNKLMQSDYIIPFTNAGKRGLLKHLYEGSWTPDHTDAIYPRAAEATESWNFGSGNNPTSTLWLMNSSYLRMKSVNIGYTFSNKPFLKKMGMSSLSITLSGYNLLTFSPLKLIDPEGNTTNSGGYPISKIYSFGLNFNF